MARICMLLVYFLTAFFLDLSAQASSGIRKMNVLLIAVEGKRGTELYDHKKDPNEYDNRAMDPEFSKIQEEMRILLKQKEQL